MLSLEKPGLASAGMPLRLLIVNSAQSDAFVGLWP